MVYTKEMRSQIAKKKGLGKHIRTEKIKLKMYTAERAEKISKKLKGNKNCLGKKNGIKNGYWIDNGYKRIGRKGFQEHRVIWEKYNGNIPDGYEIHHKNHIRDDNKIENLECISKKEHAELHWKERRGG